jgi:putative transcriptional regulator
MAIKPKFKSDAFESIHTSARGLHEIGALDKVTMRHFDEACLSVPPLLAPEQIKRIREQNRVSQSIFANYLNTSPSTVQKWETGAKQPSGMALKLLAIVQKHGLAILS